jgi:putative membrane protein
MKKYWLLIILFGIGLIWSGIHPYNRWHWIGEVSPNVLGLLILLTTFKRFRFTYLTYVSITIACMCIFIGAHYTFSRVPYFKEMGEWIGLERNNFDKLGHFFQGVVPTLIARELFLRRKLVTPAWAGFLSFCVAMTTAAIYEIIEYITCMIAGKQLDAFTGTQGFVWDSQTDMLSALIGSLFVLVILIKAHNRMMRKEFPDEI